MPDERHTDASPRKTARPADRDQVLELNFVPDWARKPPAPGAFDLGPQSEAAPARRSPRPRRQDRRAPSPPRGAPGRARRTESARTAAPPPRQAPPSIEPAPVTVRFLPEQKRLSAVIREVAATKRSYPLMAVASLFLSDPKYCSVKLEWPGKHPKGTFYQCRFCQVVALTEEPILTHIAQAHLDDVFAREETETDPPSGNFPCVARVGRNGPLVAPPNHHSFDARVRELHETLAPGTSSKQFKSRLEMDHSPEAVDAWKEAARRQVVYRPRNQDSSESALPPMARAEAELHMRREVAPGAVQAVPSVVIPATVARTIPDPALMAAVREAWNREAHFPFTLSIALRGAFRHRHLHLFKAGKKTTFVTAVQPEPLDPEFTVDNIREMLNFLADHPGCTRDGLVKALRPEIEPGSEALTEFLAPLRWLVEKGHIIEFFNGTLSVPLRGGRHAVAAGKPPRVTNRHRNDGRKGSKTGGHKHGSEST